MSSLSHIVARMGPTENRNDGAALKSESERPEGLVLVLRDISRVLLTFLTAQARSNGLGLRELITLARSADGQGVAPYEAGRALGLRASTMTSLADRLERDDLIRREAHPTDRRLLLLKATPRGRKLLDRIRGPLFESLAELVGVASQDEREFLTRFLEQTNALLLEHTIAESDGGPMQRRPTRRPRQTAKKRAPAA